MMTRRQSDGFRVHRFRREKWSDDWIGTDGPLRPRHTIERSVNVETPGDRAILKSAWPDLWPLVRHPRIARGDVGQ